MESFHPKIFKKHEITARLTRTSHDDSHLPNKTRATRKDKCAATSLICIDCLKKTEQKNRESLVVAPSQKTRSSLANDALRKRKRRSQVTGVLDLLSHQFEGTPSEFNAAKDDFSPFRAYFETGLNTTVLPSFSNIYSPIRNMFGTKNRDHLKSRASIVSENITQVHWNEGFRDSGHSIQSSNELFRQEASSQTDWKVESSDLKKLLIESEFVNEIVRRCLWQMRNSASSEEATKWLDANQMTHDVSKLLRRKIHHKPNISSRTKAAVPRDINVAYESDPVKPPFLTEPGSVYHQVIVTEKRDSKQTGQTQQTLKNQQPVPKTGRALCICDSDEKNPTSGQHCFDDDKYNKIVAQLVDLLEGLISEQAGGCECDEKPEGGVTSQTRQKESEIEAVTSIQSDAPVRTNSSITALVGGGPAGGKSVKIVSDDDSSSIFVRTDLPEACPCPPDGAASCGGGKCFLKELFDMYAKGEQPKTSKNPTTRRQASSVVLRDRDGSRTSLRVETDEACRAPCSKKTRATAV